ncbi:unnamed protein product [Ectocarpus sp. CCAP 1310/34]|nr:unnamed protein product [Ectocarpus sp. CCAP 1310/34]
MRASNSGFGCSIDPELNNFPWNYPDTQHYITSGAYTVAPEATAAPAAAILATVVTTAPGTTSSPEATRVSTLPRELPTQSPGAASTPSSTISPGTPLTPNATSTPEANTAPVADSERVTPAPVDIIAEVERPGTTAAGAVTILALIGILVISTGSVIRSNRGNDSSASCGSGSGDSFLGAPVAFRARSVDALAPADGTAERENPPPASNRRPSATLTFVLMTQLQFLATLSLVDYVMDEDSWLADFVTGLRWINLWWLAEVGQNIASDESAFEAGASGIRALVFVGNVALVKGILLAIFFIHVAAVSGVEALWLTKKPARENLDAARRRGAPIGELQARLRGVRIICRTNPDLADPSPFSRQAPHASGTLSTLNEEESDMSDEEEGGRGRVPMRSENRLNPVATCREHSTSAWLHFPHVELVFQFFAFEGAVASFASAIRNYECPKIFYTAIAAMVLCPLLMFVTVFRTLLVRVRPNVLLIFKTYAEGGTSGDAPSRAGGFLSRFKSSWEENYSLFSWADKRQWETAQTPDRQISREGDWCRIGFEPVFVEYTKRGTWFIVISLVEWVALALVGVMVENSIVQLVLFCGLPSVIFLILMFLKPFANSVTNNIEACVTAIDAISMGVFAASALWWEGTDRAAHLNTSVVVLQLLSLFDEEREARDYIRSYTRRQWCGTWCTVLGHNVFACARDTSEGVRKPRFTTAARSGPYPPLDRSKQAGGTEDNGIRVR